MSLFSIFHDTTYGIKALVSKVFYDISSKTLSTPNISIEPDTSNVNELRFKELGSNGDNYVGFKSPDALSADVVWTLPIADGSPNQILKTDGSKNLSFVDQAGASSSTRDEFDSTGQTEFTASRSMTDKLVIVTQNGIQRRPGASYDYTISGTTLTFNYTIPNGHWVTIIIVG